MEGDINIGEIKNAIKTNKENAQKLMSRERAWVDKHTRKDFESRPWGIYDENISHFDVTFAGSLPAKHRGLRDYIESTLSKESSSRNFTGIEFGGPGSRLFSSFKSRFWKQTIGVCLADMRDETEIKKDPKRNHKLIIGDVVDVRSEEVYKKIDETFGGMKVDLIISRMAGGLDHIKKHPAILDRIIRKWYSLLGENGIMFIQFEFNMSEPEDPYDPRRISVLTKRIQKWMEEVTKKFPQIEIQIDPVGKTMRIHKNPGAPMELTPAKELFN